MSRLTKNYGLLLICFGSACFLSSDAFGGRVGLRADSGPAVPRSVRRPVPAAGSSGQGAQVGDAYRPSVEPEPDPAAMRYQDPYRDLPALRGENGQSYRTVGAGVDLGNSWELLVDLERQAQETRERLERASPQDQKRLRENLQAIEQAVSALQENLGVQQMTVTDLEHNLEKGRERIRRRQAERPFERPSPRLRALPGGHGVVWDVSPYRGEQTDDDDNRPQAKAAAARTEHVREALEQAPTSGIFARFLMLVRGSEGKESLNK